MDAVSFSVLPKGFREAREGLVDIGCGKWLRAHALEKDIKYLRVFQRSCVDSNSINVPVPRAFGAEPAAIECTQEE